MTTDSADSNVPEPNIKAQSEPETSSFVQEVTPLLTDLLYPSESDEPLEPVDTYLRMAEPLTVSHIKDWLMLPPSNYVDEITEAEFWEPVVTIEDWFGDEEKAKADQFQKLKTYLETTLTDRQVFRVGQTEIDVYLLGKPKEGEPRVGLKTKVVET
ncbi:nuclease A inhibitor family protein [Fibrella forsythiae]|uniref:Nuclease A inhibitor family protein n=1 Tax=Fibrella forsythiae TaxID=2817061 RepID=A0ABS3JFG9_9BACT|nr:nuclease A inhibitor family protein [Fibrella forsythiae]MBO0947657.1 nuclease A inhibitor family protein [Fibrella forsythiae]